MKTNKVLFVGWFIMTVLIIGSVFGILYGKDIGYYESGDSRSRYILTGEQYGVVDLLPVPLGISLLLLVFLFHESIVDFVYKRKKT